jgi:hypothetical protein
MMMQENAEIRAVLGQKHRSHADLARALQWTEAKLSRRLNGHVPWTVEDVELIGSILDVPRSQLLDPMPAVKAGVMINQAAGQRMPLADTPLFSAAEAVLGGCPATLEGLCQMRLPALQAVALELAPAGSVLARRVPSMTRDQLITTILDRVR